MPNQQCYVEHAGPTSQPIMRNQQIQTNNADPTYPQYTKENCHKNSRVAAPFATRNALVNQASANSYI